jgi:Glycine cleavage system T protein (aminomethyltransferase)
MSFRRVNIGNAPVWLSRMTYTGDLGYEIWIAPEYQRYLFDLIWDAGNEFDMRLFGFRALITMRLEKTSAPGLENIDRSTRLSKQAWSAR